MIPELGVLALVLALLMALVQCVLPLAGAHWGIAGWMQVARPAALGQCLFVALAFACLAASFLRHDFSVLYVASHSHLELPAPYRFAAVWGGHEGSLLLWAALLAGWSLAVAAARGSLPEAERARVLGVLGGIAVGLLLFLLFLSNPFERLLPPALNGRDLNPLLQDPGMAVHPPVLYLGYVGFSVPFACAVAALLAGRLDAAWARRCRPWVLAAWSFLSLGILLGSAWAYYVLGWGGWWFWDPVENASLLPWLVGTALLHSLAVTEKRGACRAWTALLAIAPFALSLVGTFLVRSGVITSVHAFAVDPARGVFILAFLVAVVGGALWLFAWRAPQLAAGGAFSPVSRESLLLANNVLLAVAAAAVLIGTVYPLALELLGGGRISVGPPYFEAVVVPLVAPALILMGVGPMARWQDAPVPELARQLRGAALASGAAALALGLAWRPSALPWSPLASFGLLLALWIVASAGAHALQRRGRRQPLAWYGMLLAHVGVGVFVFGATLANGFETRRELTMRPGERATLAGLEFELVGVAPVSGPNYEALQATVRVTREGRAVATLQPQKRSYRRQEAPIGQTALDTGFMRDLLVALGEPAEGGAWSLRLQVKPFMAWIWAGGLLIAVGGLLAAAGRRARRTAPAAAAAPLVLPSTVREGA